MKQFMFVALLSIIVTSRSGADDISAYALTAGQEVAATKKKLNANDGIFSDINFRGTLVRPVRPEERAPTSAEVIKGQNSADSD